MSGWVKFENTMPEDDKLPGISDKAFRLWMNAICYCSRGETDGKIPGALMTSLSITATKKTVTELLDAGLLEEIPAGYAIPNYLKFNPSRERISEFKEAGRRRQALFRDNGLKDRIRARDGNRCRYCGEEVDWRDRRSAKGGTYDHVDPDGGNTEENLVVACRGCNSAKGRKLLVPSALSNHTPRSQPVTKLDTLTRESVPVPVPRSMEKDEGQQPGLTRERVDEAVAILAAVWPDVDEVGVENASATEPAGDLIRAAHLAASWGSDPGWRMGAASSLRSALRKLDAEKPVRSVEQRRGAALKTMVARGGTA